MIGLTPKLMEVKMDYDDDNGGGNGLGGNWSREQEAASAKNEAEYAYVPCIGDEMYEMKRRLEEQEAHRRHRRHVYDDTCYLCYRDKLRRF